MFSNYEIIKILENCFQNMICFPWIKLILVIIHLKYWYYNTSSLEIPYLLCHLCQIFFCLTGTPLQHNPHHLFFISFPILSCPIQIHTTIIGYIKPYVKPGQSNFSSSYMQNIVHYWSNTLTIKRWIFKRPFSFKFRQHQKQ